MNGERRSAWFFAAAATAGVSALFLLVTLAILGRSYYAKTHHDPLSSPRLAAMFDELSAQPHNDALREEIRRYDLELRREYWMHKDVLARGVWLVAVGVVALLVSVHVAVWLRRRHPLPGRSDTCPGIDSRQASLARWGVGALVAVLVAAVGMLVLGGDGVPADAALAALLAGRDAPDGAAGEGGSEPVPPSRLAVDVLARWSRFRGDEGMGVYAGEAPVDWDGQSGRGIRWEAPLGLIGQSSPVIWGDRLFVTGADRSRRQVYCFDAHTGEALWTVDVRTPAGEASGEPQVYDDTIFAASTAATDGERVFALFANGDLVCLDFDGRQLWARHLGLADNVYGHSSSLAVWEGKLLVQYDQGYWDEGLSQLLALDVRTGRTVWAADREVGASWATPIVVPTAGGVQVIACGDPSVIAHDLQTGATLWRADTLGADLSPSPIYAAGLVITANGDPGLSAIRPDGEGDVTDTHLAWEHWDDAPDVPSPVSDGELLYTVTSGGRVVAYELPGGEKLWEQDISGEVYASPSLAGGRLYVLTKAGAMHIFQPGREAEELGVRTVDGRFGATPAFAHGRIYLRADDRLYCIDGSSDE